MRGSISTDIQGAPERLTGLPGAFCLSSPFLRQNSSTFCLPSHQRRLVVDILVFSGRRISQVLNLRHCDIMDNIHVWFKGHKRGIDTTIALPVFIVSALRDTNPCSEKIFTVNYQDVYTYVLRHVDKNRLVRTKKNRSVTHLFRKESLRKQLLEYGNTLDVLVKWYGWEDKRSAFYYL